MNELAKFTETLPEKFSPAGARDASAQLARLFGMLLSQKKEGLSQAVAKEYLDAIEKFPIWAIETAVTKFIQGSYEWVSEKDRKFVPMVSDFVNAVRGELSVELRKERHEYELSLQKRKMQEWREVRSKVTEESKQRVIERLEKWKKDYHRQQLENAKVGKPEKSIFEITNERFDEMFAKDESEKP